jgi:hypothetical protein
LIAFHRASIASTAAVAIYSAVQPGRRLACWAQNLGAHAAPESLSQLLKLTERFVAYQTIRNVTPIEVGWNEHKHVCHLRILFRLAGD